MGLRYLFSVCVKVSFEVYDIRMRYKLHDLKLTVLWERIRREEEIRLREG